MEPGETSTLDAIELRWNGPFGWPGYSMHGQARSLADSPVGASAGVYLWTIEYLGGFLIYAAGITRRPFLKRLGEHTRAYRSGIYTLFDMEALKQGLRQEIWHGFWTKKRSPEKQSEYNKRREELRMAAETQLSTYRIFTASPGTAPRVLERIEASIMQALYDSPPPVCNVPDRGMALAPRWSKEPPIIAQNITSSLLHAIPKEMVV